MRNRTHSRLEALEDVDKEDSLTKIRLVDPRKWLVPCLLCGWLLLSTAGHSQAGSFVLERIAGGNVEFDRLVLLNDRNIAFRGIFPTGEGTGKKGGLFKFIDGTLVRVADEDTPIPGRDDFFKLVGYSVSIFKFGDGVAFLAGRQGATHVQATGIYTEQDGNLATLVDDNTPVPEGFGDFVSFAAGLDLGEGKLAFSAWGGMLPFTPLDSARQHGIYVLEGGNLSKVVDLNTPIAGRDGTFEIIRSDTMISLGDGNFAFQGGTRMPFNYDNPNGIYKTEGESLVLVADTDTPIPGGSGTFFARSGNPVFKNLIPFGKGGFAFIGYGQVYSEEVDDQQGIYTYVEGTLGKVADLQTPAPDGSGNFTHFSNLITLGNGQLAFLGVTQSGSSIYVVDQHGLKTVVNISETPVPGGFGNFTRFRDLTPVGDESVAFIGGDLLGQEGIYINFGGDLVVVADSNTPIPEGVGSFTGIKQMWPERALLSIRDGLVFVGLGDDQEAIYLALLDQKTGDDGIPDQLLEGFTVSKAKITVNKKDPSKSKLFVEGGFQFSTVVELQSVPVRVVFFAGPYIVTFATSPGSIECDYFVCNITPERSSFTKRKENGDSIMWQARSGSMKFTIVRTGSNWTFNLKVKNVDLGGLENPVSIGLAIKRHVGPEPFPSDPLDFIAVGTTSLEFRTSDTKNKVTFVWPL